MIMIDIKMPSKTDLMRAAMAEIEKQITKKARDAAAREFDSSHRHQIS